MKKTIKLHRDKETKGTTRFIRLMTEQANEEERVADSIYIRKPFFTKCDEITLTIEDKEE